MAAAGIGGRPPPPAAAQGLNLGDGGRAFVEAAAVLRAAVTPTAAGRLGLGCERNPAAKHVDQPVAALGVLLFAQHLRKKQHGEAVAVGVAIVAGGRLSDQAVGAAAGDEIVNRAADVGGVFALHRGRAFAQQRNARHPGHRRWILIAACGPMP